MNLQTWLDEMKKLDEEATKGPWEEYDEPSGAMPGSRAIRMPQADGDKCFAHHYPNNSKFIAHARTELPKAVRLVEFFLNEAVVWKSHDIANPPTKETQLMLIENYSALVEKILNEGEQHGL